MAEFYPAFIRTMDEEGGYRDNPADVGNYNSNNENVGTNYGVTPKLVEKYLGIMPDADFMKGLSLDLATEIAKTYFWDPYNLDYIANQATAEHIFDIYYNHATKTAAWIVESALEYLQLENKSIPFFGRDDKINLNDIEAINYVTNMGNEAVLNQAIVLNRLAHYSNRVAMYPDQEVFFDGWTNRAKRYWIPGTKTVLRNAAYGLLAITGIYMFERNRK